MKEDFPGLVNCENLWELSWQLWPSDNHQVENDWMPFLSTPQNSHIKETFEENPNLRSIFYFSQNRFLLIRINQVSQWGRGTVVHGPPHDHPWHLLTPCGPPECQTTFSSPLHWTAYVADWELQGASEGVGVPEPWPNEHCLGEPEINKIANYISLKKILENMKLHQ